MPLINARDEAHQPSDLATSLTALTSTNSGFFTLRHSRCCHNHIITDNPSEASSLSLYWTHDQLGSARVHLVNGIGTR
ncbi:uncharacterized protein BBA_10294 [Beauveria bassiana ARSEF 2860]|uniref:Uncharacterized protein n=1 Tax=Beauveria bassiana (strain ARSEF 2860) TaxID=655819 RepID=J5J9J7_BEAB2|nr:uncharacterized protein BBA_10294 [Beauveria bassiana ARSEF 2860]EJP60756.1 hypothetical protein BBA_10294 [Beauveria bassiana ARSEF 2860]